MRRPHVLGGASVQHVDQPLRELAMKIDKPLHHGVGVVYELAGSPTVDCRSQC